MQTELNVENGRKAIHVVLLRHEAYRSAQTSCDMIRGILGVMETMAVARIVPNSQEPPYR